MDNTMAEKHKTKYKEPKDMAKSQKAETRKDIKDYTSEDNYGMVPNSTKQMQPLVARKYATEVIDDVENMVPKITDRLYKKVEEGEYTAEHARKVFEKLQIADTEGFLKKLERINHGAITNSLVKPENEETIKESVSKLSESEKEQVIRKYVRNKIAKVLRENYVFEQEDVEVDAAEADADVDTPDVDADTPETDTATPDLGGDTTSFTGGGGSSSPSPSPSPTAAPAADTDTTTDTSSQDTAAKMKSSINSFVSDIKLNLANATPLEVAPDVVQPIKDLMKGMTTKKATEFKKAIATAMRNADIKLPTPSPSDDYTENEA
tara:strand:+ start:93 stop:1055 length:963 start_codon:yes stop_codon:yes gene_type:complete